MAESSDRLNYTTKRPTLSVTLINKGPSFPLCQHFQQFLFELDLRARIAQ